QWAKIAHPLATKGARPGRSAERIPCAPATAYAVQAAIFRLAPVPHARSTLLIPPGDLLVVGIGHANLFLASCRNARLRRRQSPGLKRLALRIVCRHYTCRPCAAPRGGPHRKACQRARQGLAHELSAFWRTVADERATTNRHRRLLRARRERPGRRAPEQRDEIAPPVVEHGASLRWAP